MAFFNLKSKSALIFGITLGVAVAARCLWLWQPQRQVERHHAALLASIGDRDWKELDHLIASDFKHPIGHDKAWILKEAGEIRRHFFSLGVRDRGQPEIVLAPAQDSAVVNSVIRLEGNGTAIAQFVISKVNETEEPFTFTWERRSWKPWDWQLAMADHPLIAREYRSGW